MKEKIVIEAFFLYLVLFVCVVPSFPQTSSNEEKQSINAAEEKKQIEQTIMQFEDWPMPNAQKAAKILVEKGEKAAPFLIATLKNGKLPFREASAFCLGQIKSKEAFPALIEAAEDKTMPPKISTIFTAMASIDGEQAYPIILKFLESSNQTFHSPAYQTLASLTTPQRLPVLHDSLKKSKSSTSRKYIVQLIGSISEPKILDILVDAMNDSSSYVAYEAATILGKSDSESLRQRLLSGLSDKEKRFRGYCLLVLVLQEDRFNKPLIPNEEIPALLQSIKSDDCFVKGTAAIALVNLGFSGDNHDVAEVMDKLLVPLLIDILSGKIYFKDFIALRELAYKKLTVLTGKDMGYPMDKWWAWWHTNSVQFHAIRLLKGISTEEAKTMSLEYKYQGGVESEHILFLASPLDPNERKGLPKVVMLDWTQTKGLLDLLQKIKFFDLKPEYGEKQSAVWRSVNLSIKNLKKSLVVYGNDSVLLEPVVGYLMEIAENNVWQVFWDSSQNPEWNRWFEGEQKWFEEAKDELIRNRRIKKMILNSYGWLKPEEREFASSRFLALMEKDKWLPKGYIELGIFHVRSEMELNRNTEPFVRALALSQNSLATGALMDFLIMNYSPKARKLMVNLLENSEKSVVIDYLKHPNGYVRSVAAEVTGKGKAEELTILYLIGMMKDDHIEARRSAITALGDLKAKLAWEQLLQLIKSPQENILVKQSAIQAIAKISETNAMPVLLDLLNSNDVDLRSGIAVALGDIGGTTALQSLIAILNGDSSKIVRQVACNSLVKIKAENVIDSLAQVAQSEGNKNSRILAVQTIRRIGSSKAVKPLSELIENQPEDIQIEAAVALSDFYDRRAIPALISFLDKPGIAHPIRKYLEKLCLVAFPEQEKTAVKQRYEDWWRMHKDMSTRQWFFDALRSRQYNVTPFLDYLLEGKKKPEAVPVLIQALNDKDWFIRAMSCHLLHNFTGKSFGAIHYYTGEKTTSEILKEWREWYAAQNGKK